MKAKDPIEKAFLPRAARKPAKEMASAPSEASGIGAFVATLTRTRAEFDSELPRRRAPRRAVSPAKGQPKLSQPSLLSRALSWFRASGARQNQLRLAETVSLGEKRFVAIIQVEGRKFLIGGGTAGVSLLTQLDETAQAGKVF
jgi:hypothetical protein